MSDSTALTGDAYRFQGGFPTRETVDRAYDDADLVRAVTAYRFFYPFERPSWLLSVHPTRTPH